MCGTAETMSLRLGDHNHWQKMWGILLLYDFLTFYFGLSISRLTVEIFHSAIMQNLCHKSLCTLPNSEQSQKQPVKNMQCMTRPLPDQVGRITVRSKLVRRPHQPLPTKVGISITDVYFHTSRRKINILIPTQKWDSI